MDIDITGARILISRPEWGGFMLTETVVVTWVVMPVSYTHLTLPTILRV